jgi:hypothetical protein
MEGRLLRPFWPLCSDKGDAHHRPVDEPAPGMRRAARWILLVGEVPGEGTPFSQRQGYPRPTSSASCSCSVGTRRTLASRIRLERSCLNNASQLLAAATTSLPLRATHCPSSPRRISDRRGGSIAAPFCAGLNHIGVVLSYPAYNLCRPSRRRNDERGWEAAGLPLPAVGSQRPASRRRLG